MNPIVPSAFGWSSGMTPLPWNVVATGMPSRSENLRNAPTARSRATPAPASTTGCVAAASAWAARCTWSSDGEGSRGTFTFSGRASVVRSATSSGNTRNVAPGRSVSACLKALRTISGAASRSVIMSPHFVSGR